MGVFARKVRSKLGPYSRLAQSVARLPVKEKVLGPSPRSRAINGGLAQLVEQ